jgi:hypothetical protein
VNEDRRPVPRDGDHDRYEVLAAGWAVHALEPDEETEFADHLARCEECGRTVAELQVTLGQLAYAAPAVEPPPGLLDRIHEAVAAEDAGPGSGTGAWTAGAPPADVVPLRSRRAFGDRARRDGVLRDRATRWVAAAACLVLVVVAAWNLTLQREVAQQRQLAAQREAQLAQLTQPGLRIAALRPYDAEGAPVAYVFSRGDVLDVVTSGMGENRPGRDSFWLWGMSDQRRVPLGRFDVRTDGMTLHTLGALPAVTGDVKAFAVSVEPGTARPVKPTRIVALGGVER